MELARVQSQHQSKRAVADAEEQERRARARLNMIEADPELDGSLKLAKTEVLDGSGAQFDLTDRST